VDHPSVKVVATTDTFALLVLHEEADNHEMKLLALVAVSDYAAMMAHEAEMAADKAAASK
jgi:hypothetical protein